MRWGKGGDYIKALPIIIEGNWTEDLHGLEGKVNVITLGTDRRDEGKLDPFIIHKHSRKDAIELAMTILTFITGIKPDNSEKFRVWLRL